MTKEVELDSLYKVARWHAFRGRIMVQAVGRVFDVPVMSALLTLFVDQVRTTTKNRFNDAALVNRCSML